MNDIMTDIEIEKRARYFYVACLAIFGYRLLSSTLFSQLSQPVLIQPSIDNTYWLFHWLGIPHTATHSMLWSAILDFLLFLLPVMAIMSKQRQPFAILFTLLAIGYQITISTYSIHHYHGLVGVMVLSLPFWSSSRERFAYLWQGARYYFFFIFCSAAIWKLSRGSVFYSHEMSNIMMEQHAQYMSDYPSTYMTTFYAYLISHTAIAQSLLWAAVLLQLSYVGGFVTQRFDRLYIGLTILFVLANYATMSVFSFDLLVFCLVLWAQPRTIIIPPNLRHGG